MMTLDAVSRACDIQVHEYHDSGQSIVFQIGLAFQGRVRILLTAPVVGVLWYPHVTLPTVRAYTDGCGQAISGRLVFE